LVVVQFTVSITLLRTIIVFGKYICQERPVGLYPRDDYSFYEHTEIYGHYNALRDDLLKTGVLENMTESQSPTQVYIPTRSGLNGRKRSKCSALFGIVAVTHDFGKTIGWNIKEGP